MEPFLLIEREGPIAIVTLNNPNERNAISTSEQVQEIADFCFQATRDLSLRAVILTGAGKSFCAGGNIKNMQEKSGMFAGSPFGLRNYYRTGIQMIPQSLYELEIPVIAAINGAAIGAGLDLACMCDVRIASDKALFGETFVNLGIVPGDGGAWFLPRIVGMSRASLMTLTGEVIDAAKALEYGLVSDIVAPDALLDRAMEIARTLAGKPGHATRMAKRLLREGQDMKLGPLLELSAAYQALAHHTEDHTEAVNAFMEKREPNLKNQ